MKPTDRYFNRVALAALILFPLIIWGGCSMKWKQGKCKQWGVCQVEKDSTHIIDSTYYVPIPYHVNGDTAWIRAYFDCTDSMQVVLRNYEMTNGRYIRLVKEVEGGKYTVYSYLPPRTDTVQVPGKTRIEYRDKLQNIYTNELTKWQRFKNNAFWPLASLCFVLICLVAVYIIYRVKRRIRP